MSHKTVGTAAVAWRYAMVALFALTACVTLHSYAEEAEASRLDSTDFQIDEYNSGTVGQFSLLNGRFSNGANLLLIHSRKGENHGLRFIRFDAGTFSVRQELTLPRSVAFVDLLGRGSHDEVIFYRSGTVWQIKLDTNEHQPLAHLPTTYRGSYDVAIPRVPIARDLNDDGLDDLIMPDLHAFSYSLQTETGEFDESTKIGPPEPYLEYKAYGDDRTYAEVGIDTQNIPWYLNRVRSLDFNRDGLTDLAFWSLDHFDIYLQTPDRKFNAEPQNFETDVQFNADGGYALTFLFGDANVLRLLLGLRRKDEFRTLSGFQDFDADGVDDLVVVQLSGRSPLRLRARYEVYFGRPTDDGTTFNSSPDATIEPRLRGMGGSAWGYASHNFVDIDGDGDRDLVASAVNTRLTGMVKAIAANSITVNLGLYTLDERNFTSARRANRRVSTRARLFGKRNPQFPTTLFGHINDDKYMDVVVGERRTELLIYLGSPTKELFDQQPIKLSVEVPSAGDIHTKLEDLDADGVEEILIQHPSKEEPFRVTVVSVEA